MPADSPNKAMRDTVIYRCNPTRYHHTGTKWKVYPTYDCRCPIVDSIEGVTHVLRTIDYRNRNPQYHWMLDALDLRKVHIWDFARVKFDRTLLSRHKFTKHVDQGIVWGLDDPRFPTIRRIRRRGMTVEVLREFILRQGPSRTVVNLDWTLFKATNKYIDPVAPRHAAIPDIDVVTTTGKDAQAGAYTEDEPKYGKNPCIGTKKAACSPSILISQADAQGFGQGEDITPMNRGTPSSAKSHIL